MFMEEPPKQQQAQISESQAIVNAFVKQKPQLRNGFDALSLVLHETMKKMEFTFLGCGESDDQNANKGTLAPEGWNCSGDSYTFRYRHPRNNKTFVIKNLVLGESLLVHGVAGDDKDIHTFEVNINDYFQPGVALNDYEHLFKSLDKLIASFKSNIIYKMMPELAEQETRTQPRPSGPYSDPLRVPHSGRQPRSPLMEGGPYHPQFQPPPFGVGDTDLNPFGFGPSGTGGNLVGPHHPGFGPYVTDPYGGHPLGRGGRGAPHPPPPGARIDPFGPPRSGMNPFGEPDRDDMPPPGSYSDF